MARETDQKKALRAHVVSITFGDGFRHEAPLGRVSPARFKRVVTRLQNGNSLDAALIGMPGPERLWFVRAVNARAAHVRAAKAAEAKAKVEAWKAANPTEG